MIKEYQLQILSVKENSTRWSGCKISFFHNSLFQNIQFDLHPSGGPERREEYKVKLGVLQLARLFKTPYFDKINAFNGSSGIDIRPYILRIDSLVDVIAPGWDEE